MARLIRQVGPCLLQPRRSGTHFEALARAIVYQQLSGKAAGTIHGRVLDLDPRRRLRPELVRATADAALRSAGLSRQKIGYLRDLAEKVESGVVPLARLNRLDDDVIAWTLEEGTPDPFIQAAVYGKNAAAVASFAFNDRAA